MTLEMRLKIPSSTMHGFRAACGGRPRWSLLACMILCVAAFAGGCSRLGPNSIRGGRMAYNDAIVATGNEQVLAMIVRMRYEEPAGLLAVASVTAGVRIQGSVAGQFGVGASSNYAGNLVPLTAGMTYEESPTITYTPVQGETYLRQLLTPVPLDLTILLMNATGDSTMCATLLVRRINGVRNDDNAPGAAAGESSQFARIVELLASLHRRGWLMWAQEAGEKPSIAMLLQGEGDEYVQQVRELHDALHLSAPQHVDQPITIPVYLGVGPRPAGAIEIVTRSAYDLFQVASAGVDVPVEHVESGLARAMANAGLASRYVHIVRTESRPADALVAIRHHGWWYSIDSRDQETKAAFRMLEALMSARIADSASAKSAMPILTIPAAR